MKHANDISSPIQSTSLTPARSPSPRDAQRAAYQSKDKRKALDPPPLPASLIT
ncbi:hypothetical protein R3P38DRAFT_3207037 [Favolaschia claudopus]|uniref:Uncharacterized protein n=1 Tax=Favolaschia claudopus TaxID=2862362 RepID=A0AAW0AL84_9AGAR